MNKTIAEINWNDLIGYWKGYVNEINHSDLSISDKGYYEFYNYITNERFRGKIMSFYMFETNTVLLDLETFMEIELFQILGTGIDFKINGEHVFFHKLYAQ